MKKLIALLLFCFMGESCLSQDIMRFGAGFSFQDSTDFIQSFTVDFNRTKAQKESSAKYLAYNALPKSLFNWSSTDYFLKPTLDINIGESVSSSSNNILWSFNQGLSNEIKSKQAENNDNRTNTQLLRIELNPTFNSDKSFDEKIQYLGGSINYLFNTSEKTQVSNAAGVVDQFVSSEFSISVGGDYNIGSRDSKEFGTDNKYQTGGGFCEFVWRTRKSNGDPTDLNHWDFMILSVKYQGARLIDEISELSNDNYVALFKATVDITLVPKVFMFTISYEKGNLNPKYKDVDVLNFGFAAPF